MPIQMPTKAHLQGCHSCATWRGQAENLCAVFSPKKMFLPDILTRIKEFGLQIGQRVVTVCARPDGWNLLIGSLAASFAN